jgi:tetratricopeptide (TPR) repeat protein
MAARVNTKFVAIIIAVPIALALLLAVAWYVVIRTDPTEYIARGDALVAAGDHENAAKQYELALQHRNTDVDLIVSYADALAKVPRTEPRAATEALQRVVKLRATAVELRGSDDAILQGYFALLHTLGQDLRKLDAWDLMLKQADLTLGRDAGNVTARKYRGIATVQRMRMVDVEPTLRDRALEDLQAAHEQQPADHDVSIALSMWYATQSREQVGATADVAAAMANQDRAIEVLRASAEAMPGDVMRQVDLLGMYVTLGMLDDAATLATELEAKLTASPEPNDALMGFVAARLMLSAAQAGSDDTVDPSERQRVVALLRKAHDARPGDMVVTAALAMQLANDRPPTAAMTLFDEVHRAAIKAPVIEYLRLDEAKMLADAQYISVLMNVAELERDETKRERTLARAKDLLDDIVARAAESAEITFLRGRMALMNGDAATALDLLDRSIAASQRPDPRAVVVSAKARIELKQWGAAIEQLAKVRRLRPNYTPAQFELANLYLRRGDTDEAMREIVELQKSFADEPEVRMLHARALAQNGDLEQAVRVTRSIDAPRNGDVALLLSKLLLMKDDRPSAKKVLVSYFELIPNDARALELLLGLSESKEESLGYIEQARKAGLSRTADLYAARLDSNQSMSDTLSRLIDEGMADPFTRHMARVELLRTTGQPEEAQKQLAEAAKLKPDDARVIEAQFDFALTDRQWQLAGDLASRAGTLNIDNAQGRFFVARLMQARGEPDQAVVMLQSALEQRPIYADGWRMLGQVQLEMGDLANAEVSLRRALSQQPDNLPALQTMARVMDMRGQRQQALRMLRDAYRVSPGDASLRTQYLAYEQQHGDADAALKMRQSLAQSVPTDLTNRQMLALMLAERGDKDVAYTLIDALVEQYPEVRQNLAAAALVRRAAGDPQAGKQLLLTHVQDKGDKAHVEDWIMLGRYLLTLGEPDEALAAFRRGQTVEDDKVRRATRHIAAYYFGARQFDRALPHYKVLWQSDPDDQAIALQYVESLLRVGDVDESARVLAEATKRFPPSVNAMLLSAQIAQQQGDASAVRAALDKAVELAPLRGAVYYERARMQLDAGAPTKGVIADLQQAIKLDPTLLEAYRLLAAQYAKVGDRELAIRQLTTLIDLNPDEVPGRISLSELYMQGNDLVALKALLDDAARRMPDNAVWQRLLARLAQVQGRMSDAVAHLRRVWELEPTDTSLASLVRSMVANDQLADALKLMHDMPQVVQASVTVQSLQAQALAMAGETDKSRAAFRAAMKNSTTADQVMIIARQMKESLGEADTLAAIEELSRGGATKKYTLARIRLELDAQRYDAVLAQAALLPDNVLTKDEVASRLRMEGYALMMLGRDERAAEVYRRAIAADASDISSMNNLAYLLNERLNKPQDALPLAEEAAKRLPDSPNVLDTYGWVLFKLGRIDDSYRVLTQAVERGASASNLLHLAESQLARGDDRQGRATLRRAADVAKDGTDATLRRRIDARMAELGMESQQP